MANVWNKPQLAARLAAVDDLLRRFPDAGHRTLAKRLHAEQPMWFPTLEHARAALRQRTGNSGNRKYAEKRGQSRAARKPGEHPPLPKSEAKPWEPYRLDARNVLTLSDLHFPYHAELAIEAALAYGDEIKPDAILINGDGFDFYAISRHDKDPTKPKMLHELECGRQFLGHLRSRFGGVPIVWKLGNHEERLDAYLQQNAPLLFDVPAFRNFWHQPAGFVEHGITIIGEQRPILLGKLPVFHGHELGRGTIAAPVNPARGAFLRTQHTVLVGHSHQTSGHASAGLWHSEVFCWSTGCLCDTSPEYARVNRWNWGFAHVTVDENGDFEVRNMRISSDGKVRAS
jgi:predicted phosphodiesterase